MLRLLFPIFAFILGIATIAAAERNLAVGKVAGDETRRVALVIGNAAYPEAALRNPANDARAMAASLRKLGFEVIEKINASQKDMSLAIAQFGEKLNADSIALFYYAGHGMQVRGKNYLIPVDAKIASEQVVRAMAVDVDAVLDQFAASPLNIVILDACRNNPFERRFRSTGGGLAQMDAPKGVLIAYATSPGKTAADGEGKHGVYTQELLDAIGVPGLKVEEVFKRVRGNVARRTGDAQIPWEASSLTGEFYFQGAPQSASAVPSTSVAVHTPEQIEQEFWNRISDSRDVLDFQDYLTQYPQGRFAAEARLMVRKLGAPPPAVVPPAPVASVTPAPSPASPAIPDAERARLGILIQEVTPSLAKPLGLKEPRGALVANVEKDGPAAKAGLVAGDVIVSFMDRPIQASADLPVLVQGRQPGAAASLKAIRNGLTLDFNVILEKRPDPPAKPDPVERFFQKLQGVRVSQLDADAQQKLTSGGITLEKEDAILGIVEKGSMTRNVSAAAIMQRASAVGSGDVALLVERGDGSRHIVTGGAALSGAFKDCDVCPEMVVIPSGGFTRGKRTGESSEPSIHVTIRSFALGKTEVTQGQWRAIMGSNPSFNKDCGDACPVEMVSWDDAQEFVRRLTEKTGKVYRLPTDSEWGYACHARVQQQYCGSDTLEEVAWFKDNSAARSHPVGQKSANGFGLLDMSGNVSEWVIDCFNTDPALTPTDGGAYVVGGCPQRLLRGGHWALESRYLHADSRGRMEPGVRHFTNGLRVVRILQ